jgi:hypothetical protein
LGAINLGAIKNNKILDKLDKLGSSVDNMLNQVQSLTGQEINPIYLFLVKSLAL